MAIAVQIDVPGITLEQYDEAIEFAGFLPGGPLPAGGLFHWVAKTDAGIRIVNVWASHEEFDQFAETQTAILEEIGVDSASLKVEFFEVHNHLSGGRS
ncbi:MAG TPA: hypothetical protein VII76_16215 [Acidimicrobiales bacterium]